MDLACDGLTFNVCQTNTDNLSCQIAKPTVDMRRRQHGCRLDAGDPWGCLDLFNMSKEVGEITGHDLLRFAVRDDAAMLEPQDPTTQTLDRRGIVRHDDDRHTASLEF